MYSASAVSSPPQPHVGARPPGEGARAVASTAARPSASGEGQGGEGDREPVERARRGRDPPAGPRQAPVPAGAPTRPSARRASTRDDGARDEADRDTGQGESRLRRQHEPARLARLGCARAARQRQERDAERLDEAGGGQGRRQPQQRAADREGEPDEGVGRGVEAEQERLEHEPLADEAVQERQAGDGHGAQQEEAGRPRHAAGEAAHLLDLAGSGRGDDAARAEEQQPLEEGVVQDVEKRGRERRAPRAPGCPIDSAIIPTPAARRMMPMFSMLW